MKKRIFLSVILLLRFSVFTSYGATKSLVGEIPDDGIGL